MNRTLLLLAVVLGLAATACTPARPRVAFGAPCASCSMTITDARFACVIREGRGWKSYDSIECLLRDTPAAAATWLADYDARRLVPADSLWIVKGDFPTPMGGGYAAFASREAAESVARETHGSVLRFAGLSAEVPR